MDKALNRMEGGSHYLDMKIQPMEYALANNLNYAQANSIKYISRYKAKNGLEDLKKAIHCIELLIEHEYSPELPEIPAKILVPRGIEILNLDQSGPITNPHL